MTPGKCFAKAAAKYSRNAALERKAASLFLPFYYRNSLDLPEGKCLEIGCGTGILTKELIHHLPDREWRITDVSDAMVEACRKESGINASSVIFEAVDGEKERFPSKYALIASGLTLHWFQDFSKGCDNLISHLEPGGALICSFLSSLSFPEWRQQCSNINFKCTLNPTCPLNPSSSVIRQSRWRKLAPKPRVNPLARR